MSALEILDQVPEFARCLVLEMKKLNEPHKDAISTREAYRRYGRGWIGRYTRIGQLHPEPHGGIVMYSISEIERVKAKEQAAARLVIK